MFSLKRSGLAKANLIIIASSIFVILAFLYGYYSWTTEYQQRADAQRKSDLVRLVSMARNAIEPVVAKVRSGDISQEQGRSEASTIIRRMTYHDQYGKNYIFMATFDGVILAHPFGPLEEGVNQWDLVDIRGKYITRELAQTAIENPEGGFVSYYYFLPGSSKIDEKLSFVMGMPELQSFIGTGMYLEQIYAQQYALFQKGVILTFGLVLIIMLGVTISLIEINRRNRKLIAETEHRIKAERALRESESKFTLAFHTAPLAISITRLDNGEIIEINQQFCQLTGYSAAELIGKSSLEIGLWVDPEQRKQLIEALCQNGYVRDFNFFLKRKDGEIRELAASSRIIEINGVQCMITLLNDITELLQARSALLTLNAELEERVKERTLHLEIANKELESFSYSVSHDLRAPLRSMNGFSQALVEEYADCLDDQGKDYIRRIRAASLRMADLIDDLLALSRLTRDPIKFESIDLVSLIQDILSEFQNTEPERKVEYTLPDQILVSADHRQMRIALTNLLDNAWKFTSRQEITRLEIRCASEGDQVLISIRDNGPGFDMSHARKIFRPFERLEYTADYPGTGIGLAIVQRIVQRHKGKIWTESKPGEGATFFLTLPAAAQPAEI